MLVSEIWCDSTDPEKVGPTGKYCEVLGGEIVDYGGNILGTFTTPIGMRRALNRWRIRCFARPRKLGRIFEGHKIPHPDPITLGNVSEEDAKKGKVTRREGD